MNNRVDGRGRSITGHCSESCRWCAPASSGRPRHWIRALVLLVAWQAWQLGAAAPHAVQRLQAQTPGSLAEATQQEYASDRPAEVGDGNGEQEDRTRRVDEGRVRRWIRQLEADTLAQRDAAEQELVKLGADILPLLPTVTERTSGELKIRLARIRQSLEAQRVAQFVRPSTVTLGEPMRLADALDAIAEQTGNQVRVEPSELATEVVVHLAGREVPFWEALHRIMEQVGLGVAPFVSSENELVLVRLPTEAVSGKPWIGGALRIDPHSMQCQINYRSSLAGQCVVGLLLSWEPRLQPLYAQLPMGRISATVGEDTIGSIMPAAVPEVPLNVGGCTAQLEFPLERPPRSALQLDRLTGELILAIPSEKHEYTFRKFSDGTRQVQRYGDVTVVLEGARRNGPVWEVQLRVEFGDPQGALESFRGWILSNKAYLRDDEGHRINDVGFQTYGMTSNSVGIAYLFQINADPDDYELIYESPAGIVRHTVQFELKELPLP
ncbi:MAG: hypothetical protein KatS3mg111_0747 [Pirellulaceae bacterium]|nr:MAG: hypothetical protein KatS3mg111_0747 [Pirellulaceae bacterium]